MILKSITDTLYEVWDDNCRMIDDYSSRRRVLRDVMNMYEWICMKEVDKKIVVDVNKIMTFKNLNLRALIIP